MSILFWPYWKTRRRKNAGPKPSLRKATISACGASAAYTTITASMSVTTRSFLLPATTITIPSTGGIRRFRPRRLSSFARAVKSKFGSIRKRNGKAFVTSTIRSPLPGLVWATRTMTCCSIIVSTLPMLVSSASTAASRRRTSSWAMP